jgi:hypothetical protein
LPAEGLKNSLEPGLCLKFGEKSGEKFGKKLEAMFGQKPDCLVLWPMR